MVPLKYTQWYRVVVSLVISRRWPGKYTRWYRVVVSLVISRRWPGKYTRWYHVVVSLVISRRWPVVASGGLGSTHGGIVWLSHLLSHGGGLGSTHGGIVWLSHLLSHGGGLWWPGKYTRWYLVVVSLVISRRWPGKYTRWYHVVVSLVISRRRPVVAWEVHTVVSCGCLTCYLTEVAWEVHTVVSCGCLTCYLTEVACGGLGSTHGGILWLSHLLSHGGGLGSTHGGIMWLSHLLSHGGGRWWPGKYTRWYRVVVSLVISRRWPGKYTRWYRVVVSLVISRRWPVVAWEVHTVVSCGCLTCYLTEVAWEVHTVVSCGCLTCYLTEEAGGGLGSTHGGIVWLSHLLSHGGGQWWPGKYTRWYRVVVSLVISRRWPVVAWEVHTVVSCGCLTCYLTEVASGGLGSTHGGIVWLSHLLSHGGGQWWPGKYTRWYRVVVSLVISRRWPVVAWELHTVVSCGCLSCYLTEVASGGLGSTHGGIVWLSHLLSHGGGQWWPGKYTRWYRVVVSLVILRRWPVVAWEVHTVVSCGCLTCYLTEVACGGLVSTHNGIVWLSHLLSHGGGLWWPGKYTRWYRVVVSLLISRRWPVVAWEVHTVVSCGCLTCYLTEVASGVLGSTHGGIVWLSHLLSYGGGLWWPAKYTRWYRVVVSLVISRRWPVVACEVHTVVSCGCLTCYLTEMASGGLGSTHGGIVWLSQLLSYGGGQWWPGKYTRWYRVVVSVVILRRWPVVAWEVHTVVSCGCLTCYLTEVASGGLGSTHGGIVWLSHLLSHGGGLWWPGKYTQWYRVVVSLVISRRWPVVAWEVHTVVSCGCLTSYLTEVASGGLGSTHGGIVWLSHLLSYGGGQWWPGKYTRWYRVVVSLVILRRWPVVAWEVHTVVSCGCLTCYLTEVASGGLRSTHGGIVWLSHLLSHGGGLWWPAKYTRWYRVVVSLVISRRWPVVAWEVHTVVSCGCLTCYLTEVAWEVHTVVSCGCLACYLTEVAWEVHTVVSCGCLTCYLTEVACGGLGSTHGGIVWLSHFLSHGGGQWWPGKYTRWYRVVVSLVISRRWPVVACEVHTVVSCGCLTCYLTEVACGGLRSTHGGIVWLSHLLSYGGGLWWPAKYTRWYRVVVSLVISRRWPVVAWELHTVVSCGCLTC